MRMINLPELKVETDYLVRKTNVLYKLDYPVWLLMKQTGCRIGESLDTQRWSQIGSIYELVPQKNNNVRIIQKTELTTITANWITNGNQNPAANNYNRYVHQFHQIFGYKRFFIGQKGVSSHLLRHRIVKEKKEELGWSDENIRIWLGEKTQKAADSYIYSQIYVNF